MRAARNNRPGPVRQCGVDDSAAQRDPLALGADRNVGLDLVRATEAAAVRAYPWVGRGEKNAADGAAVDAMRQVLGNIDIAGTVVVGEGEKDQAPMLYAGELVGTGQGPRCDVAVDPIDGTSLTAAGRSHALSVIALADAGSMLDTSSVFYLEKWATSAAGRGVIDLRRSVRDNLTALASALGKPITELKVAVLDRPRHTDLIAEIRQAGAATRLVLDGDVAAGIQAALDGSDIDACVGVGGSAEGITTACALRALGGYMQARIAPRDDLEAARAEAAGLSVGRVYELEDLVRSPNTVFVATGITNGALVDGVRPVGSRWLRTSSIVLRGQSGTVRRITADHPVGKWAR